uniref:Uncharacterized protein n=1 Tax=Steinernema glaseri TaxID=37863 RepID=A0A1I7ZRH2_9BILA
MNTEVLGTDEGPEGAQREPRRSLQKASYIFLLCLEEAFRRKSVNGKRSVIELFPMAFSIPESAEENRCDCRESPESHVADPFWTALHDLDAFREAESSREHMAFERLLSLSVQLLIGLWEATRNQTPDREVGSKGDCLHPCQATVIEYRIRSLAFEQGVSIAPCLFYVLRSSLASVSLCFSPLK